MKESLESKIKLGLDPARRASKWGPKSGFWTPILDPFYSSSRGLNHIDARLGGQCNYGILGSQGGPQIGVPAPDPGPLL